MFWHPERRAGRGCRSQAAAWPEAQWRPRVAGARKAPAWVRLPSGPSTAFPRPRALPAPAPCSQRSKRKPLVLDPGKVQSKRKLHPFYDLT